ncbi:hypothetical protein [Flammeovirga aprica]|uniref:Uncharacterized protein n=1 Tax=Flammeovirga aprica JL-4 TaxID=694437 RepID=A0A7X9S0Q5_9BACT|nr:hypothetical protein [Flammeovirga aprica]NME72273.1 hypothetical protein [Flammeovirga aprica JL-4]
MKNILFILFIVTYSFILMTQEQTKAGFQIIKDTVEQNATNNKLNSGNNKSFIELLFETEDSVD